MSGPLLVKQVPLLFKLIPLFGEIGDSCCYSVRTPFPYSVTLFIVLL